MASGWSAECEDCPFEIEPDYGARVYPREEFPDTLEGSWAADRWAIAHREANPGHNPTVRQFMRWTITLPADVPATVLHTLFPDARPADTGQHGQTRQGPRRDA